MLTIAPAYIIKAPPAADTILPEKLADRHDIYFYPDDTTFIYAILPLLFAHIFLSATA